MSAGKDQNRETSIWEHITELSKRLRIIIYAVLLCTVVVMALPADIGSFLADPFSFTPLVGVIINQLGRDLLPPNVELMAGTFGGPFMVYIYASFVIGLIISAPVIAYELYKYINPALYQHERKAILSFMAWFLVLFTAGVIFAYKAIVPLTFRILAFFGPVTGAKMLISVDDFMSMVLGMFLACGFLFTFPLYFVVLVRAGILKTDDLARRRKPIYAALFIGLCILTPDPTIITDILLFLPILILMESAILVARYYEERRARSKRA